MFSARLICSASLLCAASMSAQQMVSVRSGLIHYTEGAVTVDGTQVENKNSEFSSLKTNQELKTGEGRAEVLLTPGAFLRVSENSAIRMVSTDLSNTQVEVLSGSALVEVTELGKDNAIAILSHGASLQLEKAGVYRVDSDPARIRVYEGQAFLSQGATRMSLGHDREVALDSVDVATAKHFDSKDTDDLYRWSARRSSYIAMANVSLARAAGSNSLLGSGGCYSGCWGYNSAFGMYSFLPFGSMAFSPFGDAFWSPYYVYNAPYYYYPSGGYPGIVSTNKPVSPVRGLPVVGGAGGRTGSVFAQSAVQGNSSRGFGASSEGRSSGGFQSPSGSFGGGMSSGRSGSGHHR